jgi:hypothetical protein
VARALHDSFVQKSVNEKLFCTGGGDIVSANKSAVCGHDRCDCKVNGGAFEKNGKHYCSEECAVGTGCNHPGCGCAASKSKSQSGDRANAMQGEGNRAADRRYREGVQDTLEDLSEEERAAKARSLRGASKERARDAERTGKSRARD